MESFNVYQIVTIKDDITHISHCYESREDAWSEIDKVAESTYQIYATLHISIPNTYKKPIMVKKPEYNWIKIYNGKEDDDTCLAVLKIETIKVIKKK